MQDHTRKRTHWHGKTFGTSATGLRLATASSTENCLRGKGHMPWHILPAAGLLPVFRMHVAPFLGTGTGQMQVKVPSGGAPAIKKKSRGGGGGGGGFREGGQGGGGGERGEGGGGPEKKKKKGGGGGGVRRCFPEGVPVEWGCKCSDPKEGPCLSPAPPCWLCHLRFSAAQLHPHPQVLMCHMTPGGLEMRFFFGTGPAEQLSIAP